MTLVHTALALLLAAGLATSAPPPATQTTAAAMPMMAVTHAPDPPPLLPGEDFYDQRQNGSENYRIHMDGMVVVVAPPDALLSVAGAAGGQAGFEQQIMELVSAQQAAGGNQETKPGRPAAAPGSVAASAGAPSPACTEGTAGCKKRRPSNPAKSRSQLSNFLLPLLRRSVFVPQPHSTE